MSVFLLRRIAARRRLYPLLEKTLLALGAFHATGNDLRRDPLRIVFVCTGNICRSPYAEALARQCGVSAVSCGTHAHSGSPADLAATAEAARRGIALADHRALRWQDVSLHPGDLIVAMTLRHAFAVLPRALMKRCRVLLFSSFLPQFAPIWDPYGRAPEVYREVFDLLETGVRHLSLSTQPAPSEVAPKRNEGSSRLEGDCGDSRV